MSIPVIYNSKIKGVIAIPRDKLVQNSVLNASLKTHENLTAEDRAFAISQIIPLNLNDRDLAKFILQTYKLSNTGRFSLTFNMDLDSHIKTREAKRIRTLVFVTGSEKAWPELYDNQCLTAVEAETITAMSNREYYSILNSIQTATCGGHFENIIPCVTEKDERMTVEDNGIYYNSIYSKCYGNVCLSESEQRGKIISLNGNIPQIAYVADTSKIKTVGKYCFSLMTLIERMAKDDYINPQTNEKFSDRTVSQILTKYRKEIIMYKKHLIILRMAGVKGRDIQDPERDIQDPERDIQDPERDTLERV